MFRSTRITLIALLILTGCQRSNSQYDEKVGSVFAAVKNFSGSVLIARNGEIVYEHVVGLANDESKVAVTANTKFNICSIGKMLTATMVMQLAEERKIKLDDPVRKFLPDLAIPNKEIITIHHLLSHTSGLGNYMANRKFLSLMSHAASVDDLLSLVVEMPLVFDEPGSRFSYSNSGFIVLGKIIETIEKQPYADVLKERILKRAGMTESTLTPDLTNHKEFATGYSITNQEGEWETNLTRIPPPSSDGGLFTTAEDLFAFDKALYGHTLTSAESVEKMKRPVTTGRMTYGYGMIVNKTGEQLSYGHSGGIPGSSAEYRHYTVGNNNYTLIIFANHDGTMQPVFMSIEDMVITGQFEK